MPYTLERFRRSYITAFNSGGEPHGVMARVANGEIGKEAELIQLRIEYVVTNGSRFRPAINNGLEESAFGQEGKEELVFDDRRPRYEYIGYRYDYDYPIKYGSEITDWDLKSHLCNMSNRVVGSWGYGFEFLPRERIYRESFQEREEAARLDRMKKDPRYRYLLG